MQYENFIDTSSLFKLYHKEAGTEEIMKFLKTNKINEIYMAEITQIEFCSVTWKKCRKKEIGEKIAETLIQKFETDSEKFSFVPETYELRANAKALIGKYWKEGLRTLDSIQLASALIVKNEIECLFTSDNILAGITAKEGILTR